MLYPVAIDKGDSSFGVSVPDIPGCFSGGDNYQDAMMGKAEKINVTLPSLLTRRIDQFVASHPEYDGSRSGFISRVAADKIIGQKKR
ncbi:type II toxin-antitoxin system HicB family antitoxin [Erwinia pyrifoliae]|uniref:type II toxin-antitoxin system HicB family antitoxin n=1 Tax=Erwinia pyrifoliae TaxID=79967 RepID=UPI00220B3D68|nr:type II toxin-antitoxin system HicB family antitoxin [Erwinia pyrifoliae]UWS31106.1 type II toxin-antitoxin system HicB family antitoxin [Erwinia pyrifoliae]